MGLNEGCFAWPFVRVFSGQQHHTCAGDMPNTQMCTKQCSHNKHTATTPAWPCCAGLAWPQRQGGELVPMVCTPLPCMPYILLFPVFFVAAAASCSASSTWATCFVSLLPQIPPATAVSQPPSQPLVCMFFLQEPFRSCFVCIGQACAITDGTYLDAA